MAENKHTPGPWHACRDGECECKRVMAADFPVCKVAAGEWGDEYPEIRLEPREDHIGHKAVAYTERIVYGEVYEETARANARLIAAAPDLLAACKEAERLANDWCERVGSSEWSEYSNALRVRQQLHDAIAKAKGARRAMTELTDREDEWRLRASIEHKRRSVAEQELEECRANLLAQRQSTNELQRQLSAAWRERDELLTACEAASNTLDHHRADLWPGCGEMRVETQLKNAIAKAKGDDDD